MSPRQSPRRSSNETSCTAQNSSLRSGGRDMMSRLRSLASLHGVRPDAMSIAPYHKDFLNDRQNFFDTCSACTSISLSMRWVLRPCLPGDSLDYVGQGDLEYKQA